MTYYVVVLLSGGEKVASPAFSDRAAAEAELEELRAEMGFNSPSKRSWLAVYNALASIKAAWVQEAD